MAEIAVRIVLTKLADVVENKVQVLGGVAKKVERVQRELTQIQCCLRDADSKSKEDESVKNWLNELRDVAYRIEDATDMFFLKVGYEDPSFLQKLKKLCNMPFQVFFLHKLGTELDSIQNELKEISKSRVDYSIGDLQNMSKGEMVKMPLRRAIYQEVDESEVVGMQADMKNILKLLHPDETRRRAVITIVGPGGLGKTTLAHMVYRSSRADFKYHMMLSISQQYSLADLLRKMIRQYKVDLPENLDVVDLINELKSFLSSRRYLIILDDVWEVDLWIKLKAVLPDVQNGSRILMTTRSIDVTKLADSKMTLYKLNFLDDKESLDLLLKKAFPCQDPSEECPSNLLQLADKLSKKCKGLPLALVVLGGILSTKEQSCIAWERVLKTMNWHLDGGDCMRVLAMSYEDLPHYLKPCFLYLATFPEDYMISAKRLIQMWIAEGFISQEGRPTIEIMAEYYLEELFERSMVQVSSRSTNGSIKYLQVHDLLRDIAIHEAEQENFVTIFSQASTSDLKKSNRRIRRASIQDQEIDTRFNKYLGGNTRSLLLFKFKMCDGFQGSNFRLLKVLEIGDFSIDSVHGTEYILKSSHELVHLKYLGIRNFAIKVSSLSFHCMRNLETLNVEYSEWGEFNGNALWRIGTLRHVRSSINGALIGPISTSAVSNLQTLQWVKPPKSWARKLPRLNNLRKLGVCEVEDWVTMTNLLKNLHSLVSLKIRSYNMPTEIVYPKTLPNYESLQSLYLRGDWSYNVQLEASLFPAHLTKLSLVFSKLEQNPMPELGKLKSLKKLVIFYAFSESYSGPVICSEGFPVLQHLQLICIKLKELTVAQRVMPKLVCLAVGKVTEVHLPPELQHVNVNIIGSDQ